MQTDELFLMIEVLGHAIRKTDGPIGLPLSVVESRSEVRASVEVPHGRHLTKDIGYQQLLIEVSKHPPHQWRVALRLINGNEDHRDGPAFDGGAVGGAVNELRAAAKLRQVAFPAGWRLAALAVELAKLQTRP